VNRRGMALCAAAAVLFGLSTPAASRLALRMNAFSLAGLLYLGAALAVLPFARTCGLLGQRCVALRLDLRSPSWRAARLDRSCSLSGYVKHRHRRCRCC
jgi:hypothetical protein